MDMDISAAVGGEVGLSAAIESSGEAPTYEQLDEAIRSSVEDAASGGGTIGVLLSGGVDSAVLLSYVLRCCGEVPVFTVVTDMSHPDLEAAQKVAESNGLKHHVLMPSDEDLRRARDAVSCREKIFDGDVAVYLALEWAQDAGVDTLIAADGIDELMGGYWWHANVGGRFASRKEAFEHFWGVVEEEQLSPMLRSAEELGIEVKYPFIDERVVSLVSRIPLDERVGVGKPKRWWKGFARDYVGIASEVVDRRKLGFVSALDESISADEAIWWEADYAESCDSFVKKPRKRRVDRAGSKLGRPGIISTRVSGSVFGGSQNSVRQYKPVTKGL